MIRIILSGYCGHMGAEVRGIADAAEDLSIVAGVDANADGSDPAVVKTFAELRTPADVVVDFSHHAATEALLEYAVGANLPLVLATTGHTDEERALIKLAAKKIPIFFAANYSVGIALLIGLAKKAAQAFPDAEIEIVEKHHSRKVDAPSGTALAIADAIAEVKPGAFNHAGRSGYGKREPNEIGIHSLRMGNVVGEHEVILATPYQTLTLKHEAHSRALFAEGALCAARFLIGKKPGLYDMQSMLADGE